MKDPLTPYAQKLRREQTKEERKLWYEYLRTYPVRFHRQFVIDRYIVDFYCHKAKIAIELDGSQHYEPDEKKKDQFRSDDLAKHGVQILRFSNLDVLKNFSGVCKTIDLEVKKALSMGEGG